MSKKVAPVPRERSGFSADEYNHVAVGSQLKLISLVSSEFRVEPSCLSEQENWNLFYDRGLQACETSVERGLVSAIFAYEVTAKLRRKTAMKCTARYVVVYKIPADSKEAAAEGFCRNVGSFAAYPYFRGLVAQLVSNANLILPPLPAIASTAHIPKKAKSSGGQVASEPI